MPRVESVLVQEKNIDLNQSKAEFLMSSVCSFAHIMMRQGRYQLEDLPDSAQLACHIDIYYGQVCNGGHAQFVCNTIDETDRFFSQIEDGLAAMGAEPYLKTFRKMREWCVANSDAAAEQTGFEGGIDPYLDSLDREFFEAERSKVFAAKSAEWIRSWPELRVVSDEQYYDGLKEIMKKNPAYAPHKAKTIWEQQERELGQLIAVAHNPMVLGSVNLVWSATANPRWTQYQGEQEVEVLGKAIPAYCFHNSGILIYTALNTKTKGIHIVATTDVRRDKVKAETPFGSLFSRGSKNRTLRMSKAVKICNLVKETKSLVSLQLLLQKIGAHGGRRTILEVSELSRLWKSGIRWQLASNGKYYAAETTRSGGHIVEINDDAKEARVTRDEINTYIDYVENCTRLAEPIPYPFEENYRY